MITSINEFRKYLNEGKRNPKFMSDIIYPIWNKMNPEVKNNMSDQALIDRTYKKGFRAGFALTDADYTGVKPIHYDIVEQGVEAGKKARKESGLKDVPDMLKFNAYGNKRNIEFDKIVNQYFVPLKVNEDVYYPKDKDPIDLEEEVTKCLKAYLDVTVGEESYGLVVKYEGKSVEIFFKKNACNTGEITNSNDQSIVTVEMNEEFAKEILDELNKNQLYDYHISNVTRTMIAFALN